MSCGSSGYTGIDIPCLDDCLFVIIMNNRFFRCHKMGAHLYALCAQHKCCRHSSSVCHTTGCNDRNLHGIYDLRNENHRGILPDMSSGFTPLRYQCVCTASFHSSCKCYGSYYRNDLHSCFLPHLHIFLRISGSGSYYLYALFRYDFCYFVRIRTHEHDIYSKWFVCQFFCFSDLFTYPFCRSARSSNESKPTGI